MTITARLKYLITIILPVSAVVLTGCHTDPLCYNHPDEPSGQSVAFEWSADTSAAPAGMRVWFYPCDWDGAPTPVDLPGRNGGAIELEPGRYHVIAYNNDMEWVGASATAKFETHSLGTRDADILEPLRMGGRGRAEADSVQRVAACPEPAWGTSAQDVRIERTGVATLSPRPLHCHYSWRVEGVDSLQHVARASASISGMVAEVNLATLTPGERLCTHPLPATADADAREIRGDFYTFGVPRDSTARNRMALYLVMDDGRQFKYTQGDWLDVTQQIRRATDPRNVSIVLRGLKLPSPDSIGNGAFDLTVDNWTDIHSNIDI